MIGLKVRQKEKLKFNFRLAVVYYYSLRYKICVIIIFSFTFPGCMNPLGINEEGNRINTSSSGLMPRITSLNNMKTSWNGTTEGTFFLCIFRIYSHYIIFIKYLISLMFSFIKIYNII